LCFWFARDADAVPERSSWPELFRKLLFLNGKPNKAPTHLKSGGRCLWFLFLQVIFALHLGKL